MVQQLTTLSQNKNLLEEWSNLAVPIKLLPGTMHLSLRQPEQRLCHLFSRNQSFSQLCIKAKGVTPVSR